MKSVIDLAEQVKDYAAAGKTIAPVENGTTAVGSYAIGEKFIREGVLYKAKTSITVGDTLTLNTNYELEDNVVTQISDVKQALSNQVEARAELGAHNLFDLETSSPVVETQGVTFTTNANKTVTANGQSTASAGSTSRINTRGSILKAGSYIFSAGLPATGSDTTYYCFLYDQTNSQRIATVYGDEDVAFTANSDIEIIVYVSVYSGYTANNIVYKPMIRDARDTDKAFAPYAKPNIELTQDDSGLTANAFANGAVNLLNHDCTSQTITRDGAALTLIVNDNKSITVNGTTSNTQITVVIKNDANLSGGYKLSGCPSNNNSCSLQAMINGSWGTGIMDNGNGAVANGIISKVAIVLEKNQTFTNVVFKPMITVAGMPNSDYAHYVPFAKSNRQLTDVAEQTVGGYMLKSYSSVTVTADGTKTYKTLLNELYAAISQLFTSNPNSYIKILTLRASSNYYPIYVVPQLRTTVPSNWLFQGFTFGGTNYISAFSVESSNSSVNRCDLGTGTLEDISTDIPSSGITFIVQYEIYKQIS